MTKRFVKRTAALAFLLTAGCVPFGYAYPSLSATPSVEVGKRDEEVRVFRVDVADVRGCIEFDGPDRYVFRPVPVSDRGRVPAQLQVAVDYGWIWNCIALIFNQHTAHSVRVRVYRPGFQTVEVKPWQTEGKVAWVAAPDAVSREQAVDDLISAVATDRRALHSYKGEIPLPNSAFFRSLAPGSSCAGHREALLFAAAEYESLIRPGEESRNARLTEKAQALRELAAK
jgi:hypothetical protein